MKNIFKSIVKFIKENNNSGTKYHKQLFVATILLCCIFTLCITMLPCILYKNYNKKKNGKELTGIVIDNNFSRINKYLIRLKDNERKIALKGDKSESKILIGDSVAIFYCDNYKGEYDLLYFFDYAIDERYLPDTVYYRRKFDEKRNYINL